MKYKIKKIIEKTFTTLHLDKLIWRYLPAGLYVFNFHRIGSKKDSNFARDVFSCSETAFENIVIAIKNNFKLVSANELAKLVKINDGHIAERLALITFDDGYIDNYTVAFPILRKHEMSALFFLSTSLINSKELAWWDEIAFMLRRSIGKSVSLPDDSTLITLQEKIIENQIQLFIQTTKRVRKTNIPKILVELRKTLPEAAKKLEDAPSLFMSWEDIKTMAKNNMEIGSHTISHQILTSLSNADQEYEIFQSKKEIENKTSITPCAFAYPVGSANCYDATSIKLCKQAGYVLAFNNQAGINRTIRDPFNLFRICIDTDNLSKFRLNVWSSSK